LKLAIIDENEGVFWECWESKEITFEEMVPW